MKKEVSRYELVSRRAMLKASAGLGIAIALPTACGDGDASVFAGAITDPAALQIPTTAPVTPPATEVATTAETPGATPSPTSDVIELDSTPEPTAVPTEAATPSPTATAEPQVAVAGEMVISFTYTQGATGKNERPYIAVWVEDSSGELVETVALWYQLQRRGERWLDHLHRWYEVDQDFQVQGGVADVAAVSSATREAGSYAVAWSGTASGIAVSPGSYFVCIESAREDGPYSLIRQPVDLTGTLAETVLPDDGELSAAKVRIDV